MLILNHHLQSQVRWPSLESDVLAEVLHLLRDEFVERILLVTAAVLGHDLARGVLRLYEFLQALLLEPWGVPILSRNLGLLELLRNIEYLALRERVVHLLQRPTIVQIYMRELVLRNVLVVVAL